MRHMLRLHYSCRRERRRHEVHTKVQVLPNILHLWNICRAAHGTSSKRLLPITSALVTPSYGCRLPPIDSDYLRWPTFRALFTALYIDEAHSIVSRSPLTKDGFRSAWKNLTERFENKRWKVNSHMKTLFNEQCIVQESGAALK